MFIFIVLCIKLLSNPHTYSIVTKCIISNIAYYFRMPESMVNLEVWSPPDENVVSSIESHYVTDYGINGPPTRYVLLYCFDYITVKIN